MIRPKMPTMHRFLETIGPTHAAQMRLLKPDPLLNLEQPLLIDWPIHYL
jgi:hypothetical protein